MTRGGKSSCVITSKKQKENIKKNEQKKKKCNNYDNQRICEEKQRKPCVLTSMMKENEYIKIGQQKKERKAW